MKIALQFPGQGSQAEMYLHALPAHPAVLSVLQDATEALGYDVLSLDSRTALQSTVSVQLGLLVAGVSFARFLVSEGVNVEAAAGMSVGAFSAAVVAGALTLDTALRFVQRRAELMEDVCGSGYGMAVVSGLRESQVKSLAADGGVSLANLNSLTQFVLAGKRDTLERILPMAVAAGATTARMLRMSTASHIPELEGAAAELLEFAKGLPMQDASIPLFSNRTARPIRKAEDIREDLAMNMAHPVRWLDVQTALQGYSPELLLEAPPGHSLTHLSQESFAECVVLAAADVGWDLLLRETRKVTSA